MAGKRKLNGVLKAGLILLVAGVAITASLAALVISSENIDPHYRIAGIDEYVSGNISLSSSSMLFILNPTNETYLIPEHSLARVNVTNAAGLAAHPLPSNQQTGVDYSISGGSNSTLYSNLTGTFSIISFGTSTPHVGYILFHSRELLVASGTLGTAAGVGAIFLSVPVIIVGLILEIGRRRREKNPKDPFEF